MVVKKSKKVKLYKTADYLTAAFSVPDGHDKLLPRTAPEDPCSVEFTPEVGRIDATAP